MKSLNSIKCNIQNLIIAAPTLMLSAGSFSVCPFCLPFYAGVFSFIGLGEGALAHYLSLALLGALAVSLTYALYLATKSKNYVQAVLTLCGFLVTIYAKMSNNKILLYLGLTIFVISIFRVKKSYKSCKVSEQKNTKNK